MGAFTALQQPVVQDDAAGKAPAVRKALEVIWYHGPEGMKAMANKLQPMLGEHTDISKWHIGVGFVGTEGVLVSDYGKIVRTSEHSWGSAIAIKPSPGHYAEWLGACRGEGKALCDFDYSGKLIEHNLLGNVAHRASLGTELAWDAEKLQFKGNKAANKLLTKSYREGWAPNV